jgi:hypothetical protein
VRRIVGGDGAVVRVIKAGAMRVAHRVGRAVVVAVRGEVTDDAGRERPEIEAVCAVAQEEVLRLARVPVGGKIFDADGGGGGRERRGAGNGRVNVANGTVAVPGDIEPESPLPVAIGEGGGGLSSNY